MRLKYVGVKNYQMLPYQGGQGGSNPKSIFNLIITSYLSVTSYQLSDLSFKFTDYCLLDGYAVPLATLKKSSPLITDYCLLITEYN